MKSLYEHGIGKFPSAGLLVSSQARGWKGLAAELRSHPSGTIPDICSSKTEITFALRGAPHGYVERRGNGKFQATSCRTGTIWLSPKGVVEDRIRISETIPEVLHVYIGDDQFDAFSELASCEIVLDERLYLAGLEDEFVRQICLRITGELQNETAGGSLLMEQLAAVLVTHICGFHHGGPRLQSRHGSAAGLLDGRRLKRVTDYVEDHLETDLTVAELASVACLSRFHFSRAFKAAVGESPSGYIGSRRLRRASQLLDRSELPLAEIAFSCRFSSQSAFTRAFQRFFGCSPGEYRLQHASSR